MKGSDYIARAELSDKAGAVLAVPGESCERVPAASLPWLLAQQLIARAAPKPRKAKE
jgi:hypothetical protein